MADPQKVEAGQVWYDRKTGDHRIVCDVVGDTVYWRTPDGKRRKVGKYLPHWSQDMSLTPVEPKKPDPRNAVIEAAKRIDSIVTIDEVSGAVSIHTSSDWSVFRDLNAALTALDAAKAASPK